MVIMEVKPEEISIELDNEAPAMEAELGELLIELVEVPVAAKFGNGT